MSYESIEIHGRDHGAFLAEVQSFEFWFQSVEGYLAHHPYGVDPDSPVPELEPAQHDALVTTLSTYCVGEIAALDGASGMIGFAPNHEAKIFLATQVVDEARHLEVMLHRLAELGVADPKTGFEKLANRNLLAFRRRLLEFVEAKDWEAALFAQNVILESMEFAAFHSHMKSADPRTAQMLAGGSQGRAAPHGIRREQPRPSSRTSPTRSRPARRDQEGARLPRVGDLLGQPRSVGHPELGPPRHGAPLPRHRRASGFRLMTDPLLESDQAAAEGRERRAEADDAPRRRYLLKDDTGFDEVPKKYRRFYRRWRGGRDELAPNEVLCPVCKVVIRSARELRVGDRVYCMPCMSRLTVVRSESGRLEAKVEY